MNILIVDDKPNLARVTAVALRTLGCQSCSADSTAAANRQLETEKVDAVFLDLNLNGEDGFLFLSDLAGRPNPVPVILFTAHSREDIETEALRRGAFGCLFKPFTLDDLRQQLGKIEQYRKPLANNGV
ncbi:MAG TPA: response regulator [Lacunisphaera sp.]|jgi:DNA-binding NtrC family response regulator